MSRDNHTFLGTIAKIHGVRGELIIRTANPSYDLKEDWESIFLQIEGILVPFFISYLRSFKPGEWILKVDWYEDRTQAERLVGYTVWVPIDWLEPVETELFMDELLGFQITDTTSGQKGSITDFMDIPDNPVFEVEINKEKVLIPAREEFILEVNTKDKRITFRLPEGLI
jgi:16S rRNA processing protein RimM